MAAFSPNYCGIEKANAIINFIGKGWGKTLELGCGNDFLYWKGKTKDYTGIDINKPEIKFKKFIRQNLDDDKILHFSDNTFDTLIASEVLEHLRYPDVICKEINRVAKPHAKIVITLPNEYSIEPLLMYLKGVNWICGNPLDDTGHKWFFGHENSVEFISRTMRITQVKYIFGVYNRSKFHHVRDILANHLPRWFARNTVILCTKL